MKKRILLFVILILTLSVVLIGCGNNSSITDTENITNEAKAVVNSFIEAMEQEDINGMSTYLLSDFVYRSNNGTLDKTEFLSITEAAFNLGAEYLVLELRDEVTEVITNTLIKIAGTFYVEMIDINGDYSTDNYPIQFVVEKSSSWKIKELVDP